MNTSFNAVVQFVSTRLQERHSRSAHTLGNLLNGDIWFTKTKLIGDGALLHDWILRDGPSLRSLLENENNFNDSYFSKAALCTLFWAFQISVLDHWDLLTRIGSHEEPQNSAIFAHLSTALRLLGLLDDSVAAPAEFFLYSADCKSDATESSLGCDFGILIPIASDQYKIALFQAKKAEMNNLTSIERESPAESHYQQLTRMLDQDARWGLTADICDPNERVDYEARLFGRLCFYIFWHDPRTYHLPTILSAIQANDQIAKSTKLSFLGIGKTQRSIRKSEMQIAPLLGGTWFSEAIPLLLADPESNFGLAMSATEVVQLLQSKVARPRQILGIQMPVRGLSLGDWRDLVPADLVQNEQFFYRNDIYEGREAFDAAYPRADGLTI